MKKALFSLLIPFLMAGCLTMATRMTEEEKKQKYASLMDEGMEYYRANEIAKALDLFNAAYALNSAESRTKAMLGLCYAYSGRIDRGRSMLDEYLASENDDDPFLYRRIAAAYGSCFNDPERAIAVLDASIRTGTDENCWDYIQMGYLYEKTGDTIKAKEMFIIGLNIANRKSDMNGINTADREIRLLSQ